MLKGIEFIRKKSRGFNTLSRVLSSLRVKRSNPSTLQRTLSSLLRCAHNDKRQCDVGRSMIEMLGVLAIIAVLSVGGIAGYSKAMEQFKINKSIDYITQIVSNVQTLYMQQKSYSGLTHQWAVQAGVYPENSVQLPLGGDTTVYLMSSSNGLFFGLRICGLTAKQCVALGTAKWGGDNGNGLYAVSLRTAFNILNINSGITQLGNECVGSYGNEQYFVACAAHGNNNITYDIANKYCEFSPEHSESYTDGRCIGLFFR